MIVVVEENDDPVEATHDGHSPPGSKANGDGSDMLNCTETVNSAEAFEQVID